ncbi:MAG: polyprenyl synthetase family protein [Spirochaetota bacterium]
MKLQEVFQPVQNEIKEVERELRSLAVGLSYSSIRSILERFFSAPGKYLRPALLLMSAKAVTELPDAELRSRLVKSAAGVELIHNASLVHDDVIDEDLERRGKPTVNAGHGNRIAILAGDTLYSKAFSMLIDSLPKPLLVEIVELNITMCSAEVEQERTRKSAAPVPKDLFLRINEGKTASFMSLCCKLGASLAGGSEAQVARLQSFGLNYGMAYQLFDDHADKDSDCPDIDVLVEAKRYASAAFSDLESLGDTLGRVALRNLTQHLVDVSCP